MGGFRLLATLIISCFGVQAGSGKKHPLDAHRIVGGQEVPHKQYPFMVGIQLYSPYRGWEMTCGGSVVNRVTVLTACHCATADERIHGRIKFTANPNERRVVAGTSYGRRSTDTEQTARVASIAVHPECRNFENTGEQFVNDVALYFLKDPLVYTPEVQPMKFPSLDVLAAVKYTTALINKNAWCTAIGWGRTVEQVDRLPEALMGTKVQLLKPYECRERFCILMHKSCRNDLEMHGQFCVASPTASDCYGDSGGPLVCNGYVIGTVSYGERCLPNLPTVYQGMQPILELLRIFRVTPDQPGNHMTGAKGFSRQYYFAPDLEPTGTDLYWQG